MTDNLKKLIKTGVALILFTVLVLAVDKLLFPEDAFSSQWKIKIDTQNGLSKKERVQDFKELCGILKENAPYICDYEQLYGISFEETEKYYAKLVKNAETDFEYFSAAAAFLNNLPGYHTAMRMPVQDSGYALYSYTLSNYSNYPEVSKYWAQIIKDSTDDYPDYSELYFFYINGSYYLRENDTFNGCELVSVNGIPTAEYITLFPSPRQLSYDHINKCCCRDYIAFNDKYGNECTLTLKQPDGSITEQKAYYCFEAQISEVCNSYFSLAESAQTETQTEQIIDYTADEIITPYFYAVKNENTVYMSFNDFYDGAETAVNYLTEADVPENVIIDLRNNTGGLAFLSVSLASQLSTKEFTLKPEIWYTGNYNIFDSVTEFKNKDLPFESRFGKLYRGINTETVTASAQHSYNTFILVSDTTGSAADKFTAIIKDNGLGTVIGMNNTGGEAYGSPELALLEKSGLTFFYTPYKYLNPDGSDNSVYGTAPHIYVPYTLENYQLRNKLTADGKDITSYYSRLEWKDGVLLKALELTKE